MQGQMDADRPTNFSGVEHANAMQSFNSRPQNNPYLNTDNPDWRNHPNFSYQNNNPLSPNAPQPPKFQCKALYNLSPQPHQLKSN